MEVEEKRCFGRCGDIKPLTEFTPQKQGKYGRAARCRVCNAADQRDKHAKKTTISKPISEDEKNFFRLGTHKADDRIRELEKALAVMKTANSALLEIIQDADRREAWREAWRPNIPE